MQYVKRPGTGNGRTIHVLLSTGITICGLDGDEEEFIPAPIAWVRCDGCQSALDDLLMTLSDEAESASVHEDLAAHLAENDRALMEAGRQASRVK